MSKIKKFFDAPKAGMWVGLFMVGFNLALAVIDKEWFNFSLAVVWSLAAYLSWRIADLRKHLQNCHAVMEIQLHLLDILRPGFSNALAPTKPEEN